MLRHVKACTISNYIRVSIILFVFSIQSGYKATIGVYGGGGGCSMGPEYFQVPIFEQNKANIWVREPGFRAVAFY